MRIRDAGKDVPCQRFHLYLNSNTLHARISPPQSDDVNVVVPVVVVGCTSTTEVTLRTRRW